MSTVLNRPEGVASNGVPRRSRNTARVPIKLERLAQRPWRMITNNNNSNAAIIPTSDTFTFLKDQSLYIRSNGIPELKKQTPVTDQHLIVFMRLVDTMHDITERESIAKELKISATTLTTNIERIYGQKYARFFKSFAEVVMRMIPKEYNNIKVIKSRLYNYITRLSPSKFNDGRRVEFQYNSPVTINRLSNITPVLLNKLMRTMNDSRFVVDATKYSLDTNMRLESVKRSNRQLLTFSQLIDPSSISNAFDKYLLDIQDVGHLQLGNYVFTYIHTFMEMQERFDYFYIMKDSLYRELVKNGNVMFLEQYANMFAIVCFRTSLTNKKHVPFLNAYLLNSDFFKGKPIGFDDNMVREAYRKMYKASPQLVLDVYKSSTFTKNKLSIEKLVQLSGSNMNRLHVGLEYKRSFDSLQMHYQAHLNQTTDRVKFLNKNVSDTQRALWNLFHNSTIISFDILSGLFGYIYGANVMIEYRGTYRMYSVDQSSTMRRLTTKLASQSEKSRRLERTIQSLQYVHETVNLPNNFDFTTNEKRLIQNAKRLLTNSTNDTNNNRVDDMINRLNGVYNSYVTKYTNENTTNMSL